MPTATVQIEIGGKLYQEAGFGDGPVDAAYKTISKITKTKSHLTKFSSTPSRRHRRPGGGHGDPEEEGIRVTGQGAHTDIIMAAAKAYINALNKLDTRSGQRSLIMIRPMTITEKILAEHAGQKEVEPGPADQRQGRPGAGQRHHRPDCHRGIPQDRRHKVFDPEKIVMVPDHFVPNKDIKSAQQCQLMREFAQEQGAQLFRSGRDGHRACSPPGAGPGASRRPGHRGGHPYLHLRGAGGLSTGVGSTDIAAAMVTGETWLRVPETIKFVFHGKRRPWVDGKDLILHTIGQIGVDGALYKAMEFTGEAIANLPMDSRFTMCNMAIEAGGKNGIIPPDRITKEYVRAGQAPL